MDLGVNILTLVLVIVNFLASVSGAGYTVMEEGSPNMLIGNIARDFNFTSYINEGKSLRFNFINQDRPYVAFFNISENTGDLFTAGVLDRERICNQAVQCSVLLEVVVTASKISFYEKVKVNITIEDINDHAPEFSKQSVSIELSEASSIGTSFTIDGAVDPDSPKFAVKSYDITPSGSPFSAKFSKNLDGTSSVQIIVNRELDRELMDSYQLTVVASDGGDPPKTGNLQLNITITDVNDNFPEFSNRIYNASVDEDIAINSTILQVTAKDYDLGNNGKITYSLAEHQKQENIKDLFQIDAETGQIQTNGRLVYMADHQYQIIVEATDLGVPPKTTQAFVYIQVQDVNNNAPKIQLNLLSTSQYAKVSEHADIGAVVALIVVTDDDVGWNGITNCSIDSETFALQKSDFNEYTVVVKQVLDREIQDKYNVTVYCEDVGSPPMSSSNMFTVSVIDENDHVPVFSKINYMAELEENNNIGDVILIVTATDGDIGKNAEIQYDLRLASWTDIMIESDTGIIRAMKPFDREVSEYYEFLVLAVDSGVEPHTSTATVTLKILDKNDNKPTFTLAHYEFHVPENDYEDKVVGRLVANDNDTGNNGIVTYTISENFVVPFKLDPFGFLKTKMPLDRELQNRYDFTVVATDQGSPKRLSSSVNVSVFVTDTNDNSPFIVSPEKSGRTVYLSVKTPVNTPLYLIQAHDIDEGRNAELTYRIEERNDTHIFDVNDMGQVLVARPMEKQDVNLYDIQVAVYDKGSPQNYAKTRLLMLVTVENSTSVAPVADGLHSQNLLIALTVVIVTVVLAATIVVTICVIRRMDKKKRNFFGANFNSEVNVASEGSDPHQKDFYSAPGDNTNLAPVVSHMSLDRHSMTKDYVYKPRMSTPTPSVSSVSKVNNDSMQLHGNESHDSGTQHVNRLSSLHLHQVLVQSHDQPWTSKEGEGNSDMFLQRHEADDSHSQCSEDGDSGRGGSVSDGHMGLSQDADDLRIIQLQNIVRQNGRHGIPPHLQNRDDKLSPKTSNLTPRENNSPRPVSNNHSDLPCDSRLNSSYSRSNSDIFCINKEKPSNIDRYPSYQDNNHTGKTVTFYNNPPKVKSGAGIQMGLSSISSQHHPHGSRHRPHRQRSFDTYDNRGFGKYPHPDPQRRYTPHDRRLDETMESITTTAYDDDDNTTTSGSYTIDNNTHDDFMELKVAQLKDMFV